ncbi:CE1759 family FMN reductase [Umezawaea beigongshangensis]|uniref:CE1759 family FMN reductase n=1 Tax=Umezawaea beigongshangensis TaxID=2780383 RepID=UPI0018F2387B|nr:CE1759 family FMN reductase [Umezawaea beigongshangensis]
MTTRSLAVLSAGLSVPSSTRVLADRLAAATARALAERGVEVETHHVELRELAHDVTNSVLTGFPTGGLREAVNRVVGADGLIAVTPIFTASYSGLFKSFVDVLEPGALTGKPVLLGATAGSARHSLAVDHAMRPLFAHLRTLTVPTAVFAASEDWDNSTDERSLLHRIDRAAAEFAGLLDRSAPASGTGELDDFVPFDQLIARG